MKLHLYARVSKQDQNSDIQVNELRRYCAYKNYTIVGEYVDDGFTGSNDNRPQYQKMLSELSLVDAVLVLKVDRLFRSVSFFVDTMKLFDERKIKLLCANGLSDWSTAEGRMQLQLLAVFAEYERELIRDRTKRGMAAARERGVVLGRPLERSDDLILAAAQSGKKSYRQIAQELGCSYSQVQRSLSCT